MKTLRREYRPQHSQAPIIEMAQPSRSSALEDLWLIFTPQRTMARGLRCVPGIRHRSGFPRDLGGWEALLQQHHGRSGLHSVPEHQRVLDPGHILSEREEWPITRYHDSKQKYQNLSQRNHTILDQVRSCGGVLARCIVVGRWWCIWNASVVHRAGMSH